MSVQTSTAGAIPFKRDSDVPLGSAVGSGVGVLLIALAAIVVVQLLRKRLKLLPPGTSQRLVRVLETQRLGPRTTLAVVEFNGRRYLLAQGEHGVSCVDSVAATEGGQ
jgi:flagellar biogenesis protein FliO